MRRSFLLLFLAACGGSGKGGAGGEGTVDTAGGSGSEDVDADGWTVAEGDCDDTRPDIHPGAEETACDGVDQDCDGADLTDRDGDGYDCVESGGDDCNDYDASIHPGATEICYNGTNEDCDESTSDCDCDGDGHDATEEVSGGACAGDDCDDGDPAVHPGVEDVCYDGVDADCSGNDDDDCDRDGYVSAEYGGDDCDDGDHTVNPGEAEACYDGIDNDCDESTSDCDCDGDGFDATAEASGGLCAGDDCDDADASVNPAGSELYANGSDDDCDGEVDEDAYCNLYYPLSNGSSAAWEYDWFNADLGTYTETTSPDSWDPSTGEAVLRRVLSSTTGTGFIVEQAVTCDHGVVSTTGWTLESGGSALLDVVFDAARQDLAEDASLVAGTTWSAAYDARDATTGSTLWSVTADFEVVGTETVTVGAGTFDAVVVQADYVMVGSGSGPFDSMLSTTRAGTATYWYVERLGLVYAEDVLDDGSVYETRELASYTGFYP